MCGVLVFLIYTLSGEYSLPQNSQRLKENILLTLKLLRPQAVTAFHL